MKTNSLLMVAALVASAFTTTLAEDDPRTARLAVVPVKGAEVFKVIYKSESVSKIKMNIYNASSQLVFSETVTGLDGFMRPVNFAGMEAGEYTIELVDATGKRTEKVVYEPAKAAVKKVAKNIHVTSVSKGDKKYLVSVADASVNTVTIKIYDYLANLLHVEKREINGEFAQIYNVKNSFGVIFEITDNAGNVKVSRF